MWLWQVIIDSDLGPDMDQGGNGNSLLGLFWVHEIKDDYLNSLNIKDNKTH